MEIIRKINVSWKFLLHDHEVSEDPLYLNRCSISKWFNSAKVTKMRRGKGLFGNKSRRLSKTPMTTTDTLLDPHFAHSFARADCLSQFTGSWDSDHRQFERCRNASVNLYKVENHKNLKIRWQGPSPCITCLQL